MGPKEVFDQARANRERRYRALSDPTNDSEDEVDTDRLPERAIARKLVDSAEPSAGQMPALKGKFRYDVEAIERPSGVIYDEASSTESSIGRSFGRPPFVTHLPTTETPHKQEKPSQNLRYDVDAIERKCGADYDTAGSSSSSLDLPYAVEAIGSKSGATYDTADSSSSSLADGHDRPTEASSPDVRYAIQAAQGLYGTNVDYRRPREPLVQDKAVSMIEEDATVEICVSPRTLTPASTPSLSSTNCFIKGLDDDFQRVPRPYPRAALLPISVERNQAVVKASPEFVADFGEALPFPPVYPISDMADADSESPVSKQSPAAEATFDANLNMKHTAEPLSPQKVNASTEENMKLTTRALTPNKIRASESENRKSTTEALNLSQVNDPGEGDLKSTTQALIPGKSQNNTPAKVPLPNSPYSDCVKLPFRPKYEPAPSSNSPALGKENESEFKPTLKAESPLSSSIPSGINLSPSKGSKKKKKKSPKRKKSLKKLSPDKKEEGARVLAKTSGNVGKGYSYSEMAKGDRQIDALMEDARKASLEIEVDQPAANIETHMETPKEVEKHLRTSSQKKGVWWAQEDEVMGDSEPPSTSAKRTIPPDRYQGQSGEDLPDYEKEAEGYFQTSADAEENGEMVVPDESKVEARVLSATEESEWDDEAQKAVAKHLEKLVKDIQREANRKQGAE